jgi:hypothetical protein
MERECERGNKESCECCCVTSAKNVLGVVHRFKDRPMGGRGAGAWIV